MEIFKYEGSVVLRKREIRSKLRMYSIKYEYRFAETKFLLQHIKRIHA